MSDNSNQATVKLLNSLIHLDYDAMDAYETALKHVTDAPIRAGLQEFHEDHHRHTQKLAEWVEKLGGSPAKQHDLKSVLTRSKVAVGSLSENMGVFKAMHSNEQDVLDRYEHALATITEPPGLVTTLEHHRNDEIRHTNWIDNHLDQTNQKPYPDQIAPNSH